MEVASTQTEQARIRQRRHRARAHSILDEAEAADDDEPEVTDEQAVEIVLATLVARFQEVQDMKGADAAMKARVETGLSKEIREHLTLKILMRTAGGQS